ncbi:histamine N-methyltransferase-like [Saccoglossus kowalevskii]|uniref:Histamine N-methyltransferase-like n=1 Tax=Saccoglossus kowalevskii TaxID=10224 RepID=A0ABM0GWS2_SACKO|nr:PREDICTED: histamine N-methyltransferase-like [Saccoglossus kowalevskii]
MAENTQDVYEDNDYYFKMYNYFTSKSTEDSPNQWIKEWDTIVDLIPNVEMSDSIYMLAVATGEGSLERQVIEMIFKHRPRVTLHVDVIEPAIDQINQFKVKSDEMKAKYPKLTFGWFPLTWDGVRGKQEINNKKYHLIVCVNGLYYMDDWAETINQFYNILASRGVMFITINSSESGCGNLFKNYASWEGRTTHLLTADNIIAHLRSTNVPYKRYIRKTTVDISEVFNGNSEGGNMLLDFLVQRKDFRKTAPEKLKKKVFGFIENNSKVVQGKTLITDDEIDLVVIK